ARERRETKSEFFEKVVFVNRVSKVVKGGRKFSFTASVVVGDEKGSFGCGYGKAKEVPEAIRKASSSAKKAMFKVATDGNTITHQIIGKHGAARVLLKPAKEGTGIIAGGAVRSVCEAVGIKDILTKCLKSNNALNVLKACEQGFKSLKAKDYRSRNIKGKTDETK
ncbi:MAG: 30S ribosomal protein S5, partial [Candidatus Omnitrophica bacterium]|nr:30S ribosomal protein S5 [Candidatus Omnitrophota bacterium]